jgi:hypothetical protein
MSSGAVFDASVVLNILGSGREETILRAVPGRRVVVEVTSRDIRRHPLAPKNTDDPLAPLIAAELLERISLPDVALPRFIELTGANPPDDLDDGEAAALAAGETLALSVALDEAKGRRVARARLPNVKLLSSAEIFAMPEVQGALGSELVDALFSALLNARMRVLPDQEDGVRALLGPDRVMQCASLRRRRTDRF